MPVAYSPQLAATIKANMQRQRYLDAARACDDLATKIGGQQSNLRGLGNQVDLAWQGAAGASLVQAVLDGGRGLNMAISDLQSAAQAFRAAAAKVKTPKSG